MITLEFEKNGQKYKLEADNVDALKSAYESIVGVQVVNVIQVPAYPHPVNPWTDPYFKPGTADPWMPPFSEWTCDASGTQYQWVPKKTVEDHA